MLPDLYRLREGQPIDLQALRSALLVTVDSPRLAEAVRRDLRIEPYFEMAPEGVIEQAAAKASARYDAAKGVAVIIPCHNYAQFVGQAIDSVLAQTRPPEELIIIDDASSDTSVQTIRDCLAAAGDRARMARLVALDKNIDLPGVQNLGIRLASQEHIVCLDADDRIEPAYLETLHQAMMADRSLGVAYSGVKVLSGDQYLEYADFPPFEDGAWEWMAEPADPPRTCIPKPSMFRKEMWRRCGGFQKTYAAGEDVDFWMRGLATGWTAHKATTERLFVYRVHSLQQMSRARKFSRIDHFKPWMRDKLYPFAAPAHSPTPIPDYTHPAVAVIIPVGPAHVALLPSALESVLGQTARSWQAFVINDTGAVLPPDLLDPYPFARVVDGGAMGVAHARNVGLLAAHNAQIPLVCFLDADDYLEPAGLQTMLQRYAANDAGYVYGRWIAVSEDGSQQIMETSDYRHDLAHGMGFYSGVTTLMATAHATQLQGFNDEQFGFEDWDFYIRAAITGICGARVSYPTFAYRRSTGERRRLSNINREKILAIFTERYGDFLSGAKTMASCCGGNGDGVMAAKRAVLGLADPDRPPAEGLTQMAYIGKYVGAVRFFGRYWGGKNDHDRYAHDGAGNLGVRPEDVARMANTGQWKVVETAAIPAPEPKPQPVDAGLVEKIKAAEAIPVLQEFVAGLIDNAGVTEPPADDHAAEPPKPKRARSPRRNSGAP